MGKEIQTLQATPLTFISEKRGERAMVWSERPKFKLSGEERG